MCVKVDIEINRGVIDCVYTQRTDDGFMQTPGYNQNQQPIQILA
jgi:hypothetical protein